VLAYTSPPQSLQKSSSEISDISDEASHRDKREILHRDPWIRQAVQTIFPFLFDSLVAIGSSPDLPALLY
jgi:hypothetical protein